MKTTTSTRSASSVLEVLLQTDLGFHGSPVGNGRHNLHAFAAKFPPELPRFFVEALTDHGDLVLDPMAGSGTTLVEASLLGRKALGIDRDPLALLVSNVKLMDFGGTETRNAVDRVLQRAETTLFTNNADALREQILQRLTPKTRQFIDYWFFPETQVELWALISAISEEPARQTRDLLKVMFSSIIVTKSGGVSRARDLAHSRPHLDPQKPAKNARKEFAHRASRVIGMLRVGYPHCTPSAAYYGDARHLPVSSSSIDLVVTSPPYANAIDYMRAHKFSLVWFGYAIERLSELRGQYIGNEQENHGPARAPLTTSITSVIEAISNMDKHKGKVLHNYFSDMQQAIKEIFRVVRRGGSAILVVGPSNIRGIKVDTHQCLAELMIAQGFQVVDVAERALDRDRRLMPVAYVTSGTGIEQRIHTEYVIGAVKP